MFIKKYGVIDRCVGGADYTSYKFRNYFVHLSFAFYLLIKDLLVRKISRWFYDIVFILVSLKTDSACNL